jgi:hypothetical protein
MSTARKTAIVRKANPVSETASVIADALSDVAAALCFDAATKYEGTAGEQRQIAGVMFHIAQKRFGGIKYDGQAIDQASIEQLDKMWKSLIEGRKRR